MKKIFSIAFALSFVLTACGAPPAPRTEMTVTEGDFAFSPNLLRVPLGQPVTITFVNNGAVPHDFVVVEIEATDIVGNTTDTSVSGHSMHASEYVIHVVTVAGGSNTLTFTPQKAGEYQFICTVEGHQDAGMLGKLIVVAPE